MLAFRSWIADTLGAMKQVLAVLLAANVLAPSGILASPAKYERKNVTVLGSCKALQCAQFRGA